jgi:hypothetical protein
MSVTPAYSSSPARPTETTVVNFLFSLINEDYATGNAEVVPQAHSFAALYYSRGAAQEVTFAIEFLFLSAAQLMVLDRMSDFVTSQGDSARKWWVAGGRAVMVAVVLCNAVGLAANTAAAVHLQKSADAYSAASMINDSNSTSNDDEKYVSYYAPPAAGASISFHVSSSPRCICTAISR